MAKNELTTAQRKARKEAGKLERRIKRTDATQKNRREQLKKLRAKS